jgi:hypothetical protein
MTVVDEQIAEQLAGLSRVVPDPQAPFGYGRDLSCTTELDPALAEVDPFTTRAIAEALVRRLITPNGSLIEDPDYGEDIRGMENRGVSQADLVSLASRVRNECAKDDRVDDVTVSVRASASARTLELSIRVAPKDPILATFSMTLACTGGDVILEAVS